MNLSDLLMTLTTPLGPASESTLMLQSLSATEELGRMFSIDIQALSSKPDHDPLDLLGKTVSVALETQQGEKRHLHGHVAAFGLTGLSGGFFQYRMTVQPWTTFLSRRSNCRIFQNVSVKDILKKIFDECPDSPQYKFELSLTHPVWEYCVQYRETDFNFVQRLMEQQGIYYYFEHTESSHTMVIVDSIDKHPPCSDGYDEVPFVLPGSDGHGVDIEYIDHWNISNSIRPEKMAFRHYDFKRAKVQLKSELSNPVVNHGGDKEFFDFPGSHLQVGDANQIARVRLEELQSQQLRITGSGTARGLKCGHKMALSDHPRDVPALWPRSRPRRHDLGLMQLHGSTGNNPVPPWAKHAQSACARPTNRRGGGSSRRRDPLRRAWPRQGAVPLGPRRQDGRRQLLLGPRLAPLGGQGLGRHLDPAHRARSHRRLPGGGP